MGMRTRTNQAVKDALQRAIDEVGGMIEVDPDEIGNVQGPDESPVEYAYRIGGR